MKNLRLFALLAFLGLSVSCTTTYDAYGGPRQSVDPGVALAGIAAAGLVGYAISNNRSDRNHYGHNRGYSNVRVSSGYQHNYYGGNRGYYGGGGGYSRGGYSNCY